MEFKVGDVCYSIEDEELGYIMEGNIMDITHGFIVFGNEAITSEVDINKCDGVLYKTSDEAGDYIKSLGKRPRMLVFNLD